MPFKLMLFAALLFHFTVVRAEAPTRYRPQSQIASTARARINDGRYNPAKDAKYQPAADGHYRPGQDGKYVHQNVKYIRGGNVGGVYRYRPDRFQGQFSRTPSSGSNALSPSGGESFLRPKILGKGAADGGGGWRTLRLENLIDTNGYHYLYETENGILAEESGNIEQLTATDEGLRATGFYEYTGDDGAVYRIDYVADDNGFVPQGAHLPTVPPHVPKLLKHLAANAVEK